jgi:integrase
VLQYKNTLEQFIEALRGKARFLDEIDEDVLRHYKKFLENLGYAGKTIDTRLNIVFFLLKKNGVTARIPRDEMPEIEEELAVPYSDDELKKLFAEMEKTGAVERIKGKEYVGPGFGQEIRYRFFLGTACRDREVSYASWADIDFNRKKYHLRRKEDVGFTPKSHESRTIPLPGPLVELLKKRREKTPDKRWIFVNEKGNPENHFLRKLKSAMAARSVVRLASSISAMAAPALWAFSLV